MIDSVTQQAVRIPVGGNMLEGDVVLPAGAQGIVLFAHGSGSSRHSPRNRFVAHQLHEQGIGTLLLDLLTLEEEQVDRRTAHLRFDIRLLADRLASATDWLIDQPYGQELSIGYFGASTGGGAALVAATLRPGIVSAVVSRGGRPDLAGEALQRVRAPTLLIVGGRDPQVEALNEAALAQLGCDEKQLVIVPGASHLFEEPGKLEEVASLAGEWFSRFLVGIQVQED